MANNLRMFRQARRWRQRDLADQVEVLSRRVLRETLSVTERTISRWEAGDTPSLPAQRVLAAVFGVAPDQLGFGDPVVVPGATPVSSSDELPSVGDDDAFELVARLTRSDASEATLSMLARRVDRLCREYPVRRAEELLGDARYWLARTHALTEKRLTLAQHREVLVQAGWLSALVACLTYDTGNAAGAHTWRDATEQLGNETGHAELVGWSYEIAAWIALTSGNPCETVKRAAAGERLSGTSCVGVQLGAQRARALATLGDRVGAEEAMQRGRQLLDQLPVPVDPNHHFVIDPDKADFYAVDVYRALDVRDAAAEYANRVISYCEQPDGVVRAPMRRSEALLTLGTVAARNNELDAAVDYGIAALTDSRKCLPALMTVAADLNTELREHHGAPVVEHWREALADARGGLRRGDRSTGC